jgi:hypothetical protein
LSALRSQSKCRDPITQRLADSCAWAWISSPTKIVSLRPKKRQALGECLLHCLYNPNSRNPPGIQSGMVIRLIDVVDITIQSATVGSPP